MDIRIELKGTSPLLMHNPRMIDPQYEINRQIKAISSKRKKTDQDLADMERLEWYGGIYTMNVDGNGTFEVSQPTSKVRKCLINAARISKMGRQVERSLSFRTLDALLIYTGPRDIDKLFPDERFVSRLPVGLPGGKRIIRCRPKFNEWGLIVEGLFIEDAGLNFHELEAIVELAGQAEGIGDNRANGYGRFTGRVEAI